MSDDQSIDLPAWLVPPLASPLDSPPPSVVMEAEFGARSRRGPLRPVNDDHYLIMRLGRHQETLLTSISERALPRRFDEHFYGMAVADGTGGLGEAASRLAISALVHLAIYFGRWHMRIDEPIAEEVLDRAQRFFRSIDSTLLQASHDTSPRRLHTTLTAVFTAGTELFFAHVGHSRAYVFRDNELMQLTRDHTLDRERPGKAPHVDVPSSPRDLHHILTETLGGGAPGAPRVDVERCGLLDGDLVLLCTNGLTDVAEDARIANALRSHKTPDDQCQALVDLAANSGGKDDVTALVGHYRVRG
jgi:serine/threonine protein phosphatase PrpC